MVGVTQFVTQGAESCLARARECGGFRLYSLGQLLPAGEKLNQIAFCGAPKAIYLGQSGAAPRGQKLNGVERGGECFRHVALCGLAFSARCAGIPQSAPREQPTRRISLAARSRPPRAAKRAAWRQASRGCRVALIRRNCPCGKGEGARLVRHQPLDRSQMQLRGGSDRCEPDYKERSSF
jgi:hypothetical protein